MVKAEISKGDGTKIIVEGSEEVVKRLLDYVSCNDDNGSPEDEVEKHKDDRVNSEVSISDQIDELKEEGFFDEPKTMLDIKNVLAERGMIYPLTTISGKLIGKVRKRQLGRNREEKRWKYVRR